MRGSGQEYCHSRTFLAGILEHTKWKVADKGAGQKKTFI